MFNFIIQFEHALSLLTKAYELFLPIQASLPTDVRDYDHAPGIELQKHPFMLICIDPMFGVAPERFVDNNHSSCNGQHRRYRPPLP